MKIKEPEAMREIHEIRQKMYEEIKNMTTEEMIAYHKKHITEFEAKSGIKLKRLQKV